MSTGDDARAAAREVRAGLPVDDRWPRAGGWPDLGNDPVDIAVLGLGTHATSLSATNAHLTPRGVREALAKYCLHTEPGNPALEALRIADAGDATAPDEDEDAAIAFVADAAAKARLVIVLGGDNAATVPAALGVAGTELATAGLITLDAHYDLRDGRSNGSPVARLIAAGLDPRRIVQIGIQDFANSRSYAEQAREAGITVISREACEDSSMASMAARALEIAGAAGGPVHIDIDVDVCDRAVVPGCPASMPGGLSAWQLRSFVRAAVAHSSVRSIDFTEVDATADTDDARTVRLVALGVLEAIAAYTER